MTLIRDAQGITFQLKDGFFYLNKNWYRVDGVSYKDLPKPDSIIEVSVPLAPEKFPEFQLLERKIGRLMEVKERELSESSNLKKRKVREDEVVDVNQPLAPSRELLDVAEPVVDSSKQARDSFRDSDEDFVEMIEHSLNSERAGQESEGPLHLNTKMEDKISDLLVRLCEGAYDTLAYLFPRGLMNAKGIRKAITNARNREKKEREESEGTF